MPVITIGGVVLSKDTVWANQYTETNVRQSYTETLGGGVNIYAVSVSKGQTIHLECQESGWLPRSTVEAVRDLASIPSAIYDLQLGSRTFQVVFATHITSPAAFTPVAYRLEGSSEDWFRGDIYLTTV